ncbi:MAG: Tm-1-like ATP-binding domain-containing protein, partial [Erysipelotrichaceae bacterium]|nr:Tm-1-like ATP-binding domain-containing protein [Erysipelotrichaceae bacterium]
MKTIAIIESCDTKYREAQYIRELVEKEGMKGLVIDVATGPYPSYNYDVSREDIVQ